jgi:hypothetical protein
MMGGDANMGDVETVILLLYGRPERFGSARLTLRTWYDPALHQRAWTRWAGLQPPGSVAPLVSATRHAHEADEKVMDQRRLWLQPPDRWREEGRNGVSAIVRDHQRRVFDGKRVHTERISPAQGWRHLLGDLALAEMLEPTALLPAIWIESLELGACAGLPAWRVRALPREIGAPRFPHVLWLGADAYELQVDVERGVLLRVGASLDGKEFAAREMLEVAFDEPFADDLFAAW